ncbi:MAG: hypothetical protein NUW01_18170 [Gemmatimonadaceae bacterium]|nr:hypothetical protein [Gemmatimonadaceae bacterium]
MPGTPSTLLLNGQHYRVAGVSDGTPQWTVTPAPSQEGEFQKERRVVLPSGRAGIIGSTRDGDFPSAEGVGDVTNGDTSIEGIYGAGPAITSTDLSTGNSSYSAGTIGSSMTIGTRSISGPVPSATPTAIFFEGSTTDGSNARYVYVIAGSRLHVIDPTDSTRKLTLEFPNTNGGDAARWATQWWFAMRGTASDYVKRLEGPYNGTSIRYSNTNYSATHLHAGPDALYRAFSTATNRALLKKTTSRVMAEVADDDNWAPSGGEIAGDPDIPVTNLATLGERLVVGKEDGLGEFDSDFTFRRYLEWMANFRWNLQCNFILPLGQAGEMIASFRRGLYWLPINRSIGTEVLTGNQSDKKGRYTAGDYDGTWIYAFEESTSTSDTHVIKMRRRKTDGPGSFEHHPVATRTDKQALAVAIWPGATIGGTTYDPRCYFGDGADRAAWMPIDGGAYTTGAWNIDWPLDDFGTPGTIKIPYKFEANFAGTSATATITASVATAVAGTFTNLTDDGSSAGVETVTSDGYHQRFLPRDANIEGRRLLWRISGTGSAAATQLRVTGEPIVTFLERPEMIKVIQAQLQLQSNPHNPADAEEQMRALEELQDGGVFEAYAEYGDTLPVTRMLVRVAWAKRSAQVASSGQSGVILAEVTLRSLDYTDAT